MVTIKRKSAIIECRVQSIFEPQVIWTKENVVVRESSSKKSRVERVTDVSTYIVCNNIFLIIALNGQLIIWFKYRELFFATEKFASSRVFVSESHGHRKALRAILVIHAILRSIYEYLCSYIFDGRGPKITKFVSRESLFYRVFFSFLF